MRYLVSRQLWALLAMRDIDGKTLASHTPNTQQWFSRVRHDPQQTASEAWALAVCDYLHVSLRSYFTPVSEDPNTIAA